MIALTLDRIAEITQSRLHGSAQPSELVTGPVVVDSRKAGPGGLFVALGGERADGHDFADAAVAAGATAVLGSQPVAAPQLLVDGGDAEVVAALGRLARAAALDLSGAGTSIVGVTGSSGKTTTKDMLAQVLERLGPTVAPAGSYNNEIGHPLTVLRADENTRFVVVEVAARGVGHIAHLCGIAPPRIGLVLNVGTAHIGEFGTREAITQAKGELVEALPDADSGGVAVLNADDEAVAAMAHRTRARVVTFGLADNADVRATGMELDTLGRARFTLEIAGRGVPVRLALAGAHQVHNALAVVAAAVECGMGVDDAAAALCEAGPVSRWRMEVTELADGVTVVNDAYNANPESMAAALETLRAIGEQRCCHVVLGHMAELGDGGYGEHERIGRIAATNGVDTLLAVGEEAEPIVHGANSVAEWQGEGLTVPDATGATAVLRERLRPKDVVLVKGSRVAGLEQVAEQLIAVEDAQ